MGGGGNAPPPPSPPRRCGVHRQTEEHARGIAPIHALRVGAGRLVGYVQGLVLADHVVAHAVRAQPKQHALGVGERATAESWDDRQIRATSICTA